MNEVSFKTNIQEVIGFLTEIGILKKVNYNNVSKTSYFKYSKDFFEVSRNEDYFKQFKCALENDDYDILLRDGSFFQFSIDFEAKNEVVRMAFYPSVCSVDYGKFVLMMLGETEEEVGSEYIEDYQQFLIEQETKSVTPIRYDCNSELYSELLHSAAHLHFGYEENIRIPISKRMKPTLFSKIVVEYYYYDEWKAYLNNQGIGLLYSKHDYEDLDTILFTSEDRKLPYVYIQSNI